MRGEGDHSTVGSQDSVPGKRSSAPRESRVSYRERPVRILRRVPVPVRPAHGHTAVASVQPDVRLHACGRGHRRPNILHARRPQPGSAPHGSDQPDPEARHGAQERCAV